MTKKSLVEEALLEAKAIEESVRKSAKEILPSLLRKEINELVKESINEVDEIEMDSEELLGVIDDDDMDMDMDLDMDMDMDMGMGDDTVELDLTASSDDEVMKVFKKMGPEDEIEVVKTGDGVTLTDGNEEYEIKNVSEGHHKKDETMYEIELDDDMNEMMDDDEQLYEIELDDFEEEEIEENMQRTFQNGNVDLQELEKVLINQGLFLIRVSRKQTGLRNLDNVKYRQES